MVLAFFYLYLLRLGAGRATRGHKTPSPIGKSRYFVQVVLCLSWLNKPLALLFHLASAASSSSHKSIPCGGKVRPPRELRYACRS